MADSVHIAAFVGGSLSVYGAPDASKEVVLALPLGRLLVRPVKIPAQLETSEESYAKGALQAMNPYPDEDLTVGLETQCEKAEEKYVLAGALPESSAEDIGEALDSEKLNPVKIDALALGILREAWEQVTRDTGHETGNRELRRLVLIDEASEDIAAFILDGDLIVASRAIARGAELKREIMITMLEAEDFNGEKALQEIVVAGEVDSSGLEVFAPVRHISLSSRASDIPGIEGIRQRATEETSLNALPESWRETLEETRFKSKLNRFMAAALGIWVLAMGVLFGVPIAYSYMTDHQKQLSKEHSKRYNEVKEMREKVELVQKYSDHSRGALEILKAVSDRLPKGVELNNWNFKREEMIRISGESVDKTGAYNLADALRDMKEGGEDGENVFASVELHGPTAMKGGKQKFDIECKYEVEEEQ